MKPLSLSKFILVIFALSVAVTYPAQAATINVPCDELTLVNAIKTANGTPELDTLNLAANCTYVFLVATGPDHELGHSALPKITTPITINGNGAIIMPYPTFPFRLFTVTESGNLTLNDLTITLGKAHHGGGIRNSGTLTVINSTISDNIAFSGGGIYNDINATVRVSNSEISGNSAFSEGSQLNNGGGIRNYFGTLEVTNSTLFGNNAFSGGGIYNYFGTVTVIDSEIASNSAFSEIEVPLYSSEGGGIYNVGSYGVLTVTSSTFSGNSAEYGGGIYTASAGTVMVTGSTFSGNSAVNWGGGIANFGTLAAANSTINGNSAEYGGGIYNYGSYGSYDTLTVIGSSFSGNTAVNWGGGILNDSSGTLTVVNSSFTGNSATVDFGAGGGVFNENGGTATVIGSVLTGNKAYYGGGFYNRGTATAVNNTIAGNSSSTGGGLYNFNSGALTVTNSIVWGNSTQTFNSGTIDVSHSIVQDGGFDGTGNLVSDPLFVNQRPFGEAPTNEGNYSPQADSPALNRGSNAALPADTLDLDGDSDTTEPIPFDRDGNPRVVNVVVDIGAYEHQVAAAVIVSATSVSVAEGGTTGSYTIRLASRSTAGVTVDITTGGQTSVSPASLAFTSANWATGQTVTVTAVDDTTAEGAHTDSIAHSGSSTDTAYNGIAIAGVTAHVTDNDELLDSGGFESDEDGDKVPDGWTLKNASKDKLKCNTPEKLIAYTGECAFKFKGGVGEKTELIQNIDLTDVTFAAGDRLILSAFFNGGNAAVKAKFILKVGYVGGTVDKQNVTVGPQQAYTEVTVPDLVLTSGAVEQIKVMLKHKSTAGKLLVDTASLRHALPANTTRSDILPPPAAPDGMRGFN